MSIKFCLHGKKSKKTHLKEKLYQKRKNPTQKEKKHVQRPDGLPSMGKDTALAFLNARAAQF